MARTELETPHSEEAEKAVLGTLLATRKFDGDLKSLAADDFHLSVHRKIFAAISELVEDAETVDMATMADKVGGEIAYMSSLGDWYSPRGIASHIRILRAKSLARAVIAQYQNGISQIQSGDDPIEVLRVTDERLRQVGTVTPESRNIFVPAPDFLQMQSPETSWIVEGLIERGSNGFIVAEPKGSKSYTAMALATALAKGDPWLGFNIPKRVRVAAMWREDNPSMTRNRLSKLQTVAFQEELRGWLWINTRQQSEVFLLDDPMAVRELIVNLKTIKAEFLVLDVFNVLHTGDENDNTEMRKVLREVTNIQNQTGCQVCILHHYSKSDQKSLTQRMRGSSAISGFAEYIIGLELVDEDAMIRQAKFELKSAERPAPVYYQIKNLPSGGVQFRVMDHYEPPKSNGRASALFAGAR